MSVVQPANLMIYSMYHSHILMLRMFYFKRLEAFQAPFFTTALHFPLERRIQSVKPALNQEISPGISPQSVLLINPVIPLVCILPMILLVLKGRHLYYCVLIEGRINQTQNANQKLEISILNTEIWTLLSLYVSLLVCLL